MHYSVFGSDARQLYLAALLTAAHKRVRHTQTAPEEAPVILLPVPTVTPDGRLRGTETLAGDWLRSLPPGTAVWGEGLASFRCPGLCIHQYTDYPEFAVKNAVPTAEGALLLALQELPRTVSGGRFLVIGYGRIGKALAARLEALGGVVTVARRQPDASLSYRCDRTGAYQFSLCEYDAVFNTVPAPVFSAADCAATREDCLLIDLASAPGGITKNTTRRLIHALGLPAKTAPKTAAAIMMSIILRETEESA